MHRRIITVATPNNTGLSSPFRSPPQHVRSPSTLRCQIRLFFRSGHGKTSHPHSTTRSIRWREASPSAAIRSSPERKAVNSNRSTCSPRSAPAPDEGTSPRRQPDPAPRPVTTRPDILSDRALEFAARSRFSVAEAAASLCVQAEHDRGHLASAHVVHCRRMARRSTQDAVYSRALEIIEEAMRLVPRPPSRQQQVTQLDEPRRRWPWRRPQAQGR